MSTQELELRVASLDCEHDAAAIERGVRGQSGVVSVRVYAKSAKVALSYDPALITPEALKARLTDLGFAPVEAKGTATASSAVWRNPKVLTSASSGVLLLAGWLIGLFSAPNAVPIGFYAAAILVGGYFFGREALEDLLFEHEIGIELLMSVAAIVAAIMGQPGEGAALAFLYSISEAAEGYTEGKTRAAIKALMKLVPKVALVRRGGAEQEIPVEELAVGDLFIVKPGQSIATDGVVLTGSASVNQAPVTGESVPIEKHSGEPVFAGSINGEGALEVRATKTFADNTIARIIRMVEDAQEKKGKSQRFIERFGAMYSPSVLLVGILIALVPPLLLGLDWTTWILRATVFIVAAAPCALVISIPITLVASLGTGARNGVLIKGGIYIEHLAKIRVVALDKTGTLTRGEPDVTDVIVCLRHADHPSDSAQDLLALAAGVEVYSEHPLARAITRYARAQGVLPAKAEQFRALTGAGASAQVAGAAVYVGSPVLFESNLGVSLDGVRENIERLQGEGKTVIVVGDEQGPRGIVAIRDTIRPNARRAIDALHAAGVQKVVMLTGDNERTAQVIARELGIDEIHAGLKPEDKVARVRDLAQRYGQVAMVGDGVNDAPALAEATVGVAMGAAGTDVALETADVALMADDLEKLGYALRLAQRNRRVVNQNLALSAVVIGVLVIGAVAGVFSLPITVIGHELSEFVVIGSALRMLKS
jgi:heavy metal translocating P-type ATPase